MYIYFNRYSMLILFYKVFKKKCLNIIFEVKYKLPNTQNYNWDIKLEDLFIGDIIQNNNQ